MTEIDLIALLQSNETIPQGGIFVAKGIADSTVWDKHATENPHHAVISAKDEETALAKSTDQLIDIKQHLDSNQVLLDLGSGYGRVAKYILPEFPLQGYIGVDSSFEMLTLFRERYVRDDAEQKTPLLLLNSDIHSIPLKDSSVDIIIVCAVFLHNHKDVVVKSMAEVKRVLKPGGTLLVYSSFPRAATAMGVQGKLYQAFLNLLGKPYKNGPVRYYSKREVCRLLRGFSSATLYPAGFSIIPKTLIFLPGPLERVWRLGFAEPLNRLFEKLIPKSLRSYFSVHFDVVAIR